MKLVRFDAAECQTNGAMGLRSYLFQQKALNHWLVFREGAFFLDPGPGFMPLKVLACGLCATDLARPQLPFPLPQITGHEVLAEYGSALVVIDINASHLTRDLPLATCPYCSQGFPTHCPDRLTLGIDRLPGGFATWILAPIAGVHLVPATVSRRVAPLTEPLAAALRALQASPPQPQSRVAVVGPRRLGLLLVAALVGWREREQVEFSITALSRHSHLLALAGFLGADQGIDTELIHEDAQQHQFDIVFDTTGTPSGFELSLRLAKRIVHLKSTHGRRVMEMDHLAELVIDELALIGYEPGLLDFAWPHQKWHNRHILVTPDAEYKDLPDDPNRHYYHLTIEEAQALLEGPTVTEWALPQFDCAIVGHLASADRVIRPQHDARRALVRPMGAILLASNTADTPLAKALIQDRIQIHSSRCGSFEAALQFLGSNPELARILEEDLVTHHYPLVEIQQAYAIAGEDPFAIKTIVHSQNLFEDQAGPDPELQAEMLGPATC